MQEKEGLEGSDHQGNKPRITRSITPGWKSGLNTFFQVNVISHRWWGLILLKDKIMKTKIILIASLISVGLLTGATTYARGGGGGGGGGGQGGSYGSGPSADRGNPNANGSQLKDGSGKSADRGNPNSSGTELKDGSGKANAKGQGAKDGTGNNADCPNP
ncbi:MAG: hypothetical protein K9M98_15340 [Cephaloticoccus sp.]|nr:hypothetical protein [Cephaloticoccus sp.]